MKLFQGIVTSTANQKTVRVEIERTVKHPLYQKRVKRSKTFLVHDELGAGLNDLVTIRETKPMSATKRFIVHSIDQKAVGHSDLVRENSNEEASQLEGQE